MVKVIDEIFVNFENNSWKNNPDLKCVFKGDLYHDMMIKYTSSVVISGFIGLDSLKKS